MVNHPNSTAELLLQRCGREQTTAPSRVAIIMRSMNEQPYVEPTLKSLQRQTYGDYTLYNVDSGSDDGSFEVIQKYNSSSDQIVQIAPEDYVPGKVLNSMIEKTCEPIVVFLNADAIPVNAFWLERLLEPIFAGEADATMSRQLPRESAHFVVRYDYMRGYDSKSIKGENSDFFSAVACAFKRELWEGTRFYTDGYAEDMAWSKICREKGARFQLVMDSRVEHSHNYTIRGLYKKRYRHGMAYVHIYGEEPRLFKQFFFWSKEILRDLLHAIRRLRIDTIPYNLLYRSTIHLAYHLGRHEGRRRFSLKDSKSGHRNTRKHKESKEVIS